MPVRRGTEPGPALRVPPAPLPPAAARVPPSRAVRRALRTPGTSPRRDGPCAGSAPGRAQTPFVAFPSCYIFISLICMALCISRCAGPAKRLSRRQSEVFIQTILPAFWLPRTQPLFPAIASAFLLGRAQVSSAISTQPFPLRAEENFPVSFQPQQQQPGSCWEPCSLSRV